MSRIEQVFADKNHKALIAYVTVGYPSLAATLEIVPVLASSGCDIVELGIPFSDPLADGPTIQRASYEALQQGVTPEICLEVARKLRHLVNIPLIFMGYYNPVLRYGPEPFCSKCAEVGIDGLIIPDLPPEEGAELEGLAQRQGIDLIYLLAPTSDDIRIKLVAERTRGFIYLVSITGTTGVRGALPEDLESFVAKVRARTRRPLCVGFGISTPAQARRVSSVADGIIVGSRIIELIEEDGTLANLRAFIGRLRKEIG
ncbi:MAG: tryptophan synthase subunit alpha [Dehalococcoidia bacterium]|nr:Tryptophan synthase alpha chain [Chloroflexota bacterium]MBT9159289.1 Tryptophan synthase alpha chain [Chloroflexota bacterium]MBT9161480.1 Tryptophan synthase alpha chain [Chloroflexota bacterium]